MKNLGAVMGRFLNAHLWPYDWPGLKALEVRTAGMKRGMWWGRALQALLEPGRYFEDSALTAVEIGNIAGLTEKWCNPTAERWSLIML